MSRRIDIELTSSLGDDGFTWRAAGAKQPKGTVDASVLPSGARVGDEIKVEVEQFIDGIQIVSVVQERHKADRDLLELLPTEREFRPVVETRARGSRNRDGGRDGGGRDRRGRDRRDGDRRGRGGEGRGRRRDGDARSDRRGRPHFDPPPELPKRPKPKRLRPGREHRQAVLADIPEAQRPIAELAAQGMKAVRERLRADNDKAAAAGQPTMPEASVLKMAEDIIPRLRVAEWHDRADAAKRQLDGLDLRDLRSVVAAAADPAVARDESTRELADELRAALTTKQEEELQLWFGDVDAALAVGRVIRALRLSAQPPKAGVPFPVDIAERLVNSANASLAPTDSAERWIATLEAAAFSPVHAQIEATVKPDQTTDELLATVKRLAPALPRIAALFEIEVDPNAPLPKPLRPDYGKKRGAQGERGDRKGKGTSKQDRDRKPHDDADGQPGPPQQPDDVDLPEGGNEPTPPPTSDAEPTTDA